MIEECKSESHTQETQTLHLLNFTTNQSRSFLQCTLSTYVRMWHYVVASHSHVHICSCHVYLLNDNTLSLRRLKGL